MAKEERLQMRIDKDFKKDLIEKAKSENRSLPNYVDMVLRSAVYKEFILTVNDQPIARISESDLNREIDLTKPPFSI